MFEVMYSLFWILFFSAFGSATLLPMQSELVLSGLLVQHKNQVFALVAVASLGNTLGSMVNWWLGMNILKLRDYKWFPLKHDKLEKMQKLYGKYGYWSLLLSWLPIVGDPLTLIAGVMREPLWRFTLIVAVAKTSRYVLIAATVYQLI